MNLPAKPTTEGTFAKTPFANVLLYARERKLTGSLRVLIEPDGASGASSPDLADVSGESVIVLEQGAVVALRLPRAIQPLSQVLLAMGLISPEVVSQVRDAQAKTPGTEEIAALLRLRAVDPVTLDKGLREQARRRVASLFGHRAIGKYQYYAGVDLLEGAERLRAPEDALPIVWIGFQRFAPDAAAVQSVLEKITGKAVKLKDGHEFDRFNFGEEMGLAATQLRTAPSSLDQLYGLAPDPALVRSMVYLLALAKQVEAVALPTQTSSARATSPGAVTAPTGMTMVPMPPPVPAVAKKTPLQTAPLESSQPAVATTSTPPEGSDGDLTKDPRVLSAANHLQRMKQMTFFEMFGLQPSASTEEIRARFPQVAAQWHTDKAPMPELRGLYTEIFTLYNSAFSTLADPTERQHYEETMHGGGGTINARERVVSVLNKVQNVERAEIAIKRKEYVEAERLLRDYLDANGDDIKANLLLVECLLATNPTPHIEDMARRLAKVIQSTENGNDRALMLMGQVLKLKGDKRYIGFFKQALDANPNNAEAAREWRLWEMRRNQRNEEANNPLNKLKGWLGRK
ncbi:MAG: DnaJ domain-containing protein [Polyangiales bacterium]